MSWALALFGLLPWWGWAGGLAAVGAFTALGLWPVVLGLVRTVVGLVPWGKWQTWCVIGFAAFGFGLKFWLGYHDAELAKAAAVHEAQAVEGMKQARDTFWKGREDAAQAAYVGALASLKQQLVAAKAEAAKRGKELDQELANDRVALAAAADELARERAQHVTAVANARCDLTRGVIVQFNAGAAVANGNRAAPGDSTHADSGGAEDASSGVSLDTYVAAVEQTQVILGKARKLIDGWRALRASDERLVADANKALANCIPKGTP